MNGTSGVDLPRSAVARNRGKGILLGLALLVTAAALRAWRLDRPPAYVFDEAHYVPDALSFLQGGFERPAAHPPLGKWLIAAGIRALGDNAWGWRITAVVAGSAVVLLTYWLASRLLHSRPWAILAAVFVGVDGLQIVQSRVAMLDIFLALFVLLGVLLGHVYAGLSKNDESSQAAQVACLGAAGLMFGAAVAVKWSAAAVLGLSAVVLVATAQDRRRELVTVGGLLLVVPAVVYVVSYAGFWLSRGLDLGGWLEIQRSMLQFHTGAIPTHPYASSSITWLLLTHPVAYYRSESSGAIQHVVSLGNPALWWGFLVTVPWLVRDWLRRTDQAADVVVLGVAATYVPWLVVQRTSFQYYLTPLVPFMAVGVAWALRQLWHSKLPSLLRRGLVVVAIASILTVAALLLPVWLGIPIDRTHWERLMILGSWK